MQKRKKVTLEMIAMQKTIEKGKYSAKRTKRGNVQVGRLAKKTNLEIARNMISTANLMKGKRVKKKFVSTAKLVMKREGKNV